MTRDTGGYYIPSDLTVTRPIGAGTRADLATIRAALNELPGRCRYHGDRLDDDGPGILRRDACCDTGAPARARREALAALDSITNTLEGAP